MNVESLFLNACVAKLRLSTEKIGICMGKLTDDQIWSRGNENENAVGNLVLHLAGNARQWIISGLGGKPDIRERDKEFDTASGLTQADLCGRLNAVIDEATAVIGGLTTEQLTRMYEIQKRQATGVDAVLNVVEHFAQHTGQIIFATKNLTGEELGLTIPRTRR